MDFSAIETFVKSLDQHGLQFCQNLVSREIIARPQPSHPDASELVDYHKNFVERHTVLDESIQAEIETLGFKTKSKSEAIQNKFISSFAEPYIWHSSKGPVTNEAAPMDKYPGIRGLMEQINSTYGFKMNSVLVSCYATGRVSVRAHDDGEAVLDPQQPICVVSFGANRKVEFISKWSDEPRRSDFTLEPEDRSLYIMKSGCQTYFKHRVRKEQELNDHRISLSFRCFLPTSKPSGTADAQKSTAVKTKPPSLSLPRPTSTPKLEDAPLGFSPFPGQHTINHSGLDDWSTSNGDKVCLLFGSSITTRVEENRMKKGSRTLINLSKSGAKICDLNVLADKFCSEHSDVIGRVDKIIVNIGTNDVKWFNGKQFSVHKRCFNPLTSLVRNLKYRFPLAVITFIPMLPIRAVYNYTAKTVNDFNMVLLEVCRKFGCMFFDCFSDFLSADYRDYNAALFRDKWHPNMHGLGLLCRAIKSIIFGPLIPSQVRCFWHRPFYL